MKFLAILQDSLRESLDSMALYVMAGLSLLLIIVGATMTFSPKPGGENLMKIAAVPLSFDLAGLDPAELNRRGGGPPGMNFIERFRGAYEIESVTPLPGQLDAPDSTFRVVVLNQDPVGGFLRVFSNRETAKTLDQIEERFGQLDDVTIAKVIRVRSLNKGRFEIEAQLTSEGRKLWPHDMSLFFGALPIFREGVPIGTQLYALENVLVNQIGAWVALLVSIVMTAFFVPNMLRKGTVDLLLVKPISRPVLLLYKYVGGLIFIFLNTTLAVGGLWLVLSVRSGIWVPGVLISIPAITFFFAILYSVSVLFGVMTRSAIVSILVTCLFWFILFLVGMAVGVLDVVGTQFKSEAQRNVKELVVKTVGLAPSPYHPHLLLASTLEAGGMQWHTLEYQENTFALVVRSVYRVLPRTSDLNTLVNDQLQRDLLSMPRVLRSAAQSSEPVSWAESLTVSCVFIALMLGMACWWVSTKDY